MLRWLTPRRARQSRAEFSSDLYDSCRPIETFVVRRNRDVGWVRIKNEEKTEFRLASAHNRAEM